MGHVSSSPRWIEDVDGAGAEFGGVGDVELVPEFADEFPGAGEAEAVEVLADLWRWR